MAKKGLYHNINKRKKAGTSRSKKNSTISKKAYSDMKKGFPNSKKNTSAINILVNSFANIVLIITIINYLSQKNHSQCPS